jgi:hypothetical protein
MLAKDCETRRAQANKDTHGARKTGIQKKNEEESNAP